MMMPCQLLTIFPFFFFYLIHSFILIQYIKANTKPPSTAKIIHTNLSKQTKELTAPNFPLPTYRTGQDP